ncbi:hypothetical protein RRG08_015581 [Elysia crispata]|uniref:Uncharacterized protein n=1 Tax=Elysia crispata TaxID=231223 RepID=A0AAE0YJ51_9GAST|nr:hypothetical protein RRG08_015581 [Elysia crispata]
MYSSRVDPDPPPPPPEEVPPTVAVTQPITPIPPDAPPPRQGCMDKRSTLEKVLLVLIIIILIIVLLCAAAFLVYYFFSSPPEGTCLTDDCVKAASRLKGYMDETKSPCDNFYEYACGGWMRKETLSPTETMRDTSTIVEEDFNRNMRYLLEERISKDNQDYEIKPREFYRGCMNLARIDDRGSKPFLEFLASVGEFPTLAEDWNETQADFSLEKTIINMAKLGETPLFSIVIDRDFRNPDANRIYMGDAMLSLKDQKIYRLGADNPTMEQRKTWLVDVLVLLGADKATAEADVDNIIQFEISLAKIMRDPIEKKNLEDKYNPTNTRLLKSEYPWLNWLEVFQGIGANPDGGGIVIDEEEQIINQEPEYLDKLGKIIQDTDKRVLANYMMSNLLKYTAWLGTDFTRIYDIYRKDALDVPGRERWKLCIKQTSTLFPEAVSRLYVDQHFSKESREKMDVMVKDLRRAFNDMILTNSWMTVETKVKAEDKLKRIEAKIAYPDYIMDDEKLNKILKAFEIDELKYLEMMVDHKRYKTSKTLQSLLGRPKRKEWIKDFPASLESGYSHLENDLTFPAAILQPPLFSPNYPSSMNYGGGGAWLGRDITKGFGMHGSRYDGTGKVSPWWTDEDKEGYEAQTTCFVEQYGCYKWEGNSIDGEMTLAENIADNGGLKQSYKAYRALVKRQGTEEQRLPGLDLTHNQIFFLSYAQTWCAKIRDDMKEMIVKTKPHSPYPYRVDGALQNSKEFADAFKCTMGSRMNPMRKCHMF